MIPDERTQMQQRQGEQSKGKYVDVSEWILNVQDNNVIVLLALAFVKCAIEIHAQYPLLGGKQH